MSMQRSVCPRAQRPCRSRRERAALEVLEVAVVLAAHLLVEDLDAVEPHLGRAVDAVGDVDGLALEVPEGIGGDADAERWHGAEDPRLKTKTTAA